MYDPFSHKPIGRLLEENPNYQRIVSEIRAKIEEIEDLRKSLQRQCLHQNLTRANDRGTYVKMICSECGFSYLTDKVYFTEIGTRSLHSKSVILLAT